MVCHIIPSAGREKRLPHSLNLVVIHIAEHEREIPEVILRTDEHFYAVKEVKRPSMTRVNEPSVIDT